MSENVKENEWVLAFDRLPPVNMLVKVLLINGVEKIDFVNEPINEKCPFQHYLVTKWRKLTRDELNELIQIF